MKILLDENFPIPLYHALRSMGIEAEHIIILGKRGLPDPEIRRRLAEEEIVFLTQDTEFETLAADCRAAVIISRVRQNIPIRQRVAIWSKALQVFVTSKPTKKLFDLLETGEIIPWKIRESP